MGYILVTCKNCKLYEETRSSVDVKKIIKKHKKNYPDHQTESKYINTGADTASGHEFDGYI